MRRTAFKALKSQMAKALETQAVKFQHVLGNVGIGVAMTLLPWSSARADSGIAGSAVPKP